MDLIIYGRSGEWESFSWKLFPRGGLGPKTIAIFLFQTFPETQSGESGMFPHHFHRWFCAGEHLFRSQKKTRSGSKIQKVGKRNGAAKETTKEPSPNSKRRKSLQSDSFSCKVFPAEKPCTEDFSTCKVFPYSVLNKGYLLNQKAILYTKKSKCGQSRPNRSHL